MRRKPLLGLAVALIFTTGLAGCGDDDSSVNGSAASSSSDTTAQQPTTTSTTIAAGPATQTSVPATSPKRFLTAIQVLHVDGKDVVQFTFNSSTPGYSAEYVASPITDEGEGKPVTIAGDNDLKLIFESAATVDLTGGAKEYYTGPNRVTSPDAKTVSEVIKVSEHEGRLLFGIGTKTKAPFTITSTGNIVTVAFS